MTQTYHNLRLVLNMCFKLLIVFYLQLMILSVDRLSS